MSGAALCLPLVTALWWKKAPEPPPPEPASPLPFIAAAGVTTLLLLGLGAPPSGTPQRRAATGQEEFIPRASIEKSNTAAQISGSPGSATLSPMEEKSRQQQQQRPRLLYTRGVTVVGVKTDPPQVRQHLRLDASVGSADGGRHCA